MTKLLFFFSIVAFFMIVSAQPKVRTDLNGTELVSTIPNWTCTFNFNRDNVSEVTEILTAEDDEASRDDFGFFNTNDDDIDSVSWSGTSCNCWVLLYQDDDYEGQMIGLWTTNSTQGVFDLSMYTLLEDSHLIRHDEYEQFNKALSSYRIYCF